VPKLGVALGLSGRLAARDQRMVGLLPVFITDRLPRLIANRCGESISGGYLGGELSNRNCLVGQVPSGVDSLPGTGRAHQLRRRAAPFCPEIQVRGPC
jgi:hypothetical protein